MLDWLTSEGWIIFNWWALVTLAGAAVLPLTLRLLGGLPDRGYTLARPAGVLLTAFVFWLLASLGFLNNTRGSIMLSWLIVLVVSLGVYFRINATFDLRAWWRENHKVVIVTEVLFIILLVGWATVRAYQNNFSGTEKPMDLAFMSAIHQSEQFPPNDPWLSGYTISYYYFGYVMAAMLSKMSGVWTTIGYNMHIATLFALTGTTAFGVVYNLIRARAQRVKSDSDAVEVDKGPSRNVAIGFGVLGMVFVILMGNFHLPLVEYPYNTGTASEGWLEFWDSKDRWDTRPEEITSTDLARWDNWWWFSAARAMSDQTLADPELLPRNQRHIEVIAEFPQFSFLLADSHPHVMALPYVLLAVGLALNVLLINASPDVIRTLFYGICVGGLVFLNTWDAPIYITMLVGADVLRRYGRYGRLLIEDWIQLVLFGGALLAIMLVAYLPFIVGFQSQLGGILPNIIYPTQPQQYFLVFGPFMLILPVFLIMEVWRARREQRMNWRFGSQVVGGIVLALFAALILFTVFGLLSNALRNSALGYIDASGGLDAILPEALTRRLINLPLLVLLFAGVLVIVGRLFPADRADEGKATVTYPQETGFALMMIGAALLLTLIPEFVYLRDNFGTRMNTIFKFYYQAWVLFSLASAYAIYSVLADIQAMRPNPALRFAFSAVIVIALVAGLAYPLLGIYSRTLIETGRLNIDDPASPTLDGGLSVVNTIDDYNVLMCLHELASDENDVVVAEATYTGSYDFGGAGRTGALTGLPSVLGWQGHQSQWRGTAYRAAIGTRDADIPRLYNDLRYDVVQPIIEQYGINYILYGTTERNRYGMAGEEKFAENLDVVCESGNSRVYRVDPPQSLTAR